MSRDSPRTRAVELLRREGSREGNGEGMRRAGRCEAATEEGVVRSRRFRDCKCRKRSPSNWSRGSSEAIAKPGRRRPFAAAVAGPSDGMSPMGADATDDAGMRRNGSAIRRQFGDHGGQGSARPTGCGMTGCAACGGAPARRRTERRKDRSEARATKSQRRTPSRRKVRRAFFQPTSLSCR